MTGDVLRYDFLPSVNSTYKGASFRTNRWGMRDKDYALKRPPAVSSISPLFVKLFAIVSAAVLPLF